MISTLQRLAFGGCVTVLTLAAGPAAAQIFEVIHPDVEKGGFEFEVLNGVVLEDIEDGEERSAHEIAIAYSPFSFWKTTLAIEIANPEGESAEFEAFEWENVLLLPFGGGHGAGHSHDHGGEGFFALEAVGIFAALEVPNSGGIEAGGIEVGPIAEIAFGPVETVSNFFFEVPFEDEAGTGIAYAIQAQYPIFDQVGVGFEAFGEVENVFQGETEDEHFIGPAIFTEFDLGRGRVLEPRLAFLFGLTDDAPDAVASLNFELKF
ncbi:MAG: hypothetical protein AAGE80_03850 [Pseudomonadota bacterium]